MLEVDKLNRFLPGGVAQPETLSSAELLNKFLTIWRRQFPLIALIMASAWAIGLVYLLTTPQRFTAGTMMVIDSRKVQVFQQQSVVGDVPIDAAQIETQVEVLKSQNVGLAVVKDLNLTEDPEFVGGGGGVIGAVFGLVSDLFGSAASEPKSQTDLTRRALTTLEGRRTIKRVGLTYVMEIGFTSLNPNKAAQVANAIADAYIVDQLEAKYQTTRRASVWLQDRISELRSQASAAERAVLDYKEKNNIVATGGRLIGEQQLAEVNSQLIMARASTAEARAKLSRIQEVMAHGDVRDATVTDSLHNEVINRLRSQYLDMAAREATWSVRYGKNHLAAVNLRGQMEELKRSIADELGRIAQSYQSEYEIAKSREESLDKSLASRVAESQSTNRDQLGLRELESKAQTYRALYDNFLQRYMEAVQQQSFPITEARVISAASPPLRKSSPSGTLVLALTTGLGIILSFGAAFLRELGDHVFRTSKQVENALHLNCITVLPAAKSAVAPTMANSLEPNSPLNRPDQPSKSKRGPVARAEKKKAPSAETALLHYVIEEPFSRFAEGVRAIKVAADINGSIKENKVIGITSTLPNEGKSTVACNFAQLMAHAGARVILIDGDLRNPSLSRSLAPAATVGLLEVLSGRVELQKATFIDKTTNLTVLPSILESRLSHTSEVLASEVFKKLIDTLRRYYDYVVIDLPPLAPVVDVRTTTKFIDSYVYVVEWGRTKIDLVQHHLGSAQEVYDRILGVVLNKANVKVLHRYESYYGRYYYNKYYARYGYVD